MTVGLRGRRFKPAGDSLAATTALSIPCFVAGPENRLLAATFLRLLNSAKTTTPDSETSSLSPLLVMGPSGSGKTHLAHGLAESWVTQHGDGAVAYLTASDFSRQVASAIADRTINDLRGQLRSRQLLVIDDLHRMQGDRFALEELIHTTDALHAAGGLLLATSTGAPADIPRLGSALIGRLLAGVNLTIAPLGLQARQELLRLALECLACRSTPDALALLAQDAPNDPRRLFGLALRLRGELRAGATLDRRLAAALAAARPAEPSPPATDILTRVAKYYGLPKSKMTSASRQQTTVLARAVAIYLLRELTPLSYDQIGKLLGGRDHTTMIHNFRRIDRSLATDRTLREAVSELRGSILSHHAV